MNSKFHLLRTLGVSALVAASLLLGLSSARAATETWTGATGGVWGTNTNWSASATPDLTYDLTILGPSNVAGALTLNIAAAASANSINFTDTAAVTLNNTTSGANQTLTLGAGGLTIGTGAVTIGSSTANQNINIALGASQTWNVGSGGLTVNNVISDGGSAFGLTKTGAGTLTLAGANTYTGTTAVNVGTLTLSGAISSSSALSLGGGTLSYTKAGTNTQTFNGTTINSGYSTITNSTATNTVDLGAITRNSGGVLNISSLTGTTKTSTAVDSTGILGTWATNGTGTSLKYSAGGNGSAISAYAGTAAATAANVTDTTGAVNYDVSAVGTLGASASFNTLRYVGTTGTIAGNFTANGLMNAGSGAVTYSGVATIGANKELVIVGNTQGTTISGTIANNAGGASSLVYGGPSAGTLTLSSSNSYSGGTTLNAGTITFANVSALGSGTVTSNAGTLNFGVSVNATTTNNLVVNGPTALTTIHTWTFNGNVSGAGSLSVGSAGQSILFGGNDSSYSGTMTVPSSVGNGQVVFSGTNTGSANAAFVFNNTQSGKTSVSFAGDGTISFGSMTGSGRINSGATGNKTLSVGALGLNDNFTGIIENTSGSVILTKVGTGTMTLSGANVLTGGVNINNGKINVGGTETAGTSGPLGKSGAIAFGGGALQYSSANQFDYSSRFSNAANQAYSVDTNGQSVTWAANLTSSGGSLAKSGGGTLTLSGSNSYSGSTTITGGTLLVSGTGSINGTSGITINGSGAKYLNTSTTASATPAITLTQGTLDGTNTLGPVTVANLAGNVVQNGNGGTSTLTLGALSFSGAAIVNIADSGTAGTAGINVTGALATTPVSGQVTINATVAGGNWSPITYDLIGFGSFAGSASDFTKGTITGLTNRQTATFGVDTTNNFITLTIAGDTPRWSGLDSGNWVVGTTGANSNWKLITSGTATDYIEGDAVVFNDSAEGSTSVNISAANVSPTSVTFNNNTLNYTLGSTGGFGIAGTSSVTKSGVGTVTISSSNSYTGGTAINAGTLALSGSGTLGSTSGAVTMGGGTLDLGATNQTVGAVSITAAAASGSNVIQSGTLTASSVTASNSSGNAIIAATLAGTGSVTMSGAGTLTLTGSNTYSGGTTVGTGTMVLASGGSLSPSNTLTLGSASGNTSGIFQLGDSNGVANTTVTNLSTAGSGVSNAVVGGNSSVSTLTINNSAAVSYGGKLGGAGTNQNNLAVIKNGTGALTLSGSSTYSGGTTLNSGTLIFSNANAFGTGTVALNGGTLKAGSGLTLSNNLNVTAATTFDMAGNNTTFSGGISGSAALTMSNSGLSTLNLSGNNEGYTGTATINSNSAISFISATAGSASAAWVFNDNAGDRVRINISGTNTINFGAISGVGQIQNDTALSKATLSVGALNTDTTFGGTMKDNGTGILALTKVGTGTLTLTGTDAYSGGTTISAGTLKVGNTSALGTGSVTANATLDLNGNSITALNLSGNGNGTITSGSAAAVTLTGSNSSDTTFGGTIQNGSGTVALTKTGTGALTLSGNNTYTGATNVNSGALNINGVNSGNGLVTVASGASLAGSGTLAGATVVSGSLTGSLTINNDATINSGAIAAATAFNGNIVNNGTIATAVMVQSGKTLSGAGSMVDVTVNGGATLSATSPNLTTGNLNMLTSGTFALSINTTLGTTGKITATNVTLDASNPVTLTINDNGAGAASTFIFLDYGTGTLSGQFTYTGTINGVGNQTAALIEGDQLTINGNAYTFTYAYDEGNNNHAIALAAAVPEPSTWAMMISGLGVLSFWQRSRRKSA